MVQYVTHFKSPGHEYAPGFSIMESRKNTFLRGAIVRRRIKLLSLFLSVIMLVLFQITGCSTVYCVTLDYGSSKTETFFVNYNKKIDTPKEPWKTGYIFDGWYYYSDDQSYKWDFSKDTVTRDITLHAKWTPIVNKISLELNGGHCNINYIDVTYGQEFELPIPEYGGKFFSGWYLGNNRQQNGMWKGNSDISLEAKWLLFDPDNCPTFGTYEQDCVEENGKEPIEWLVLDESADAYLLISRYILDSRMIESGNTHKSYKDCELRKWLNGVFYFNAFSSSEREFIVDTFIEDADVTDSIFLISHDEANHYFYQTDFAGTVGTVFAQNNGLERIHVTYDSWWLRNVFKKNAAHQIYPAMICYGSYTGASLGRDFYGVRPAIWVKKAAINIVLPDLNNNGS